MPDDTPIPPPASQPAPEPARKPASAPDGGGASADVPRFGLIPNRRLGEFAAVGLFILACFYTLHFARPLLMPLAIALLLGLLLAPLIGLGRRIFLPEPVAALLVLVALFASIVGAVTVLSDPASRWMNELPQISKQLQSKFKTLKSPIDDVRTATQQVDKLTTLESPRDQPQRVVVAQGGLFAQTVGVLQSVSSTLGILFATLYFLLATQSMLKDSIVRAFPGDRGRKSVAVLRRVQRSLSSYLLTVTLINAGLGLATGIALWLLDMPSPILWGAMAASLNFIPLLGPVSGIIIVAMVALITYPELSDALMVPAVYLGLHLIESQLVTPYVLGRRLTMNPVAVFLSIVFWTWLWGIPGALMAVPLLAILKVTCDAVEGLRPLSELIGSREGASDADEFAPPSPSIGAGPPAPTGTSS